MNEQHVIHQLIADVAGVKSDVRNMAEGQKEQWNKLDRCMEQIGEVNRKLDKVVGHEKRIEDVEDVVEDYRTTKNRAVSMIAGIGVGVGGISGALGVWLAKLFGNH